MTLLCQALTLCCIRARATGVYINIARCPFWLYFFALTGIPDEIHCSHGRRIRKTQNNKSDDTLIRIYYYDSPPLTTQLQKPVSGTVLDLSKTPAFLANKQRLEALKRTAHFAVREGRLTWISLNKIAERILVITGDSDFIPAIKLARRNGIQVYLFTLAHGVTHELTDQGSDPIY